MAAARSPGRLARATAVSLLGCLLLVRSTSGHGRLYEPPGRSTAWRYGFSLPRNDNDHELNCGGFSRQWVQNSGRCGICGDAWDLAQPRPNEAGGMYGRGEIVRTYSAGASIPVGVELTANHKGFFEMRVCPINSNDRPATQRCLDEHKLQLSDGGGVRYYPQPAWNGKIQLRYRLPADLTCRQCVFQWRYVAGNNWGTCQNGTEGIGCGPQEEFRACADIRIVDEAGEFDETRYDWADGELGGTAPPPDAEQRALIAETVAAVVLGVLGAIAFFVGICCWALARRRAARGSRKKRGVTFGRQIFLISNPTLTRNGKLTKPAAAVSPSDPSVGAGTDTSAIFEVSSSDGSTASRGTAPPQFAGEDQSPEPPVAPRRKRTTRLTAVEAPEQEQEQEPESRRPGAQLHISRPTQVTVNGVSVVPDPMPDVLTR